jgi:hypothetical protein
MQPALHTRGAESLSDIPKALCGTCQWCCQINYDVQQMMLDLCASTKII